VALIILIPQSKNSSRAPATRGQYLALSKACCSAGDTALLLAAKADRVEALRWLVARQCDVNARGELGRTALMLPAGST